MKKKLFNTVSSLALAALISGCFDDKETTASKNPFVAGTNAELLQDIQQAREADQSALSSVESILGELDEPAPSGSGGSAPKKIKRVRFSNQDQVFVFDLDGTIAPQDGEGELPGASEFIAVPEDVVVALQAARRVLTADAASATALTSLTVSPTSVSQIAARRSEIETRREALRTFISVLEDQARIMQSYLVGLSPLDRLGNPVAVASDQLELAIFERTEMMLSLEEAAAALQVRQERLLGAAPTRLVSVAEAMVGRGFSMVVPVPDRLTVAGGAELSVLSSSVRMNFRVLPTFAGTVDTHRVDIAHMLLGGGTRDLATGMMHLALHATELVPESSSSRARIGDEEFRRLTDAVAQANSEALAIRRSAGLPTDDASGGALVSSVFAGELVSTGENPTLAEAAQLLPPLARVNLLIAMQDAVMRMLGSPQLSEYTGLSALAFGTAGSLEDGGSTSLIRPESHLASAAAPDVPHVDPRRVFAERYQEITQKESGFYNTDYQRYMGEWLTDIQGFKYEPRGSSGPQYSIVYNLNIENLYKFFQLKNEQVGLLYTHTPDVLSALADLVLEQKVGSYGHSLIEQLKYRTVARGTLRDFSALKSANAQNFKILKAMLSDKIQIFLQKMARKTNELIALENLRPNPRVEELSHSSPIDHTADVSYRAARTSNTGQLDTRTFYMNGVQGKSIEVGLPVFVQLNGNISGNKTTDKLTGSVAYRLGNTVIGAIQAYANSGAGFETESNQLETSVVMSHNLGSFFIEGQLGMVSADNVHTSAWSGLRSQLTLGLDTAYVSPFIQISHRQLDKDSAYHLNDTTAYLGLDMDIASLTADTYALTTRLTTKVGYGEKHWNDTDTDLGATRGVTGSVAWSASLNLNSGVSFTTNLNLDTASGSNAGLNITLNR
ncbi:MAG: hypothetical protein H6492_00045 [Candidatus Paracaedibacteraceae bacterium]|nr:hypothetical protein [Candidatus Paracaedibacteraceae bacterium]